MPKILEDSGKYTAQVGEDKGQVIGFKFEFPVYDESDGCSNPVILKLANRQAKVDAGNETRAKVMRENDHGLVKVLTEEQKLANKAETKANKVLLDKIKALSLEDREALGL